MLLITGHKQQCPLILEYLSFVETYSLRLQKSAPVLNKTHAGHL